MRFELCLFINVKIEMEKSSVGELLSVLKVILQYANNGNENTRQSIAIAINSSLTALYWKIGYRIRSEILQEKRADYGKEIVATVSRQLAMEFGQGFAEKSLRRMLQFVEVFPDEQIVATLMRQLSWSHFIELIPLKDLLKRDFYAEMCRIEKWNVRTLRKKISSMLYERRQLACLLRCCIAVSLGLKIGFKTFQNFRHIFLAKTDAKKVSWEIKYRTGHN